jgi:hypothetical protein
MATTQLDEHYGRITESEAATRNLFPDARAESDEGWVLCFDDHTMLCWQPTAQLPYIPQPAGWRGGMWDERHL